MKRVRKTKEETSKEIWDVIHKIELGADKLTIKLVCDMANVSRTTLYKYDEIKNYITDKDQSRLLDSLRVDNKAQKEEIRDLKEYIKIVESERDKALINQFKIKERLK